MDRDRETLTEALAGAGYETYGGFGHDTPFVALAGRFHEHALYHNVTASAEDVLDTSEKARLVERAFEDSKTDELRESDVRYQQRRSPY